ncbi:hypothetical protein [Streptomyces sp. NPDC001508]|uniref:hypothetical protein n=1 Tax=Streptomyces sp. NPDC001508 TaxID=3154656 RepID=UPI00332E4C26
MVDGVAKSGKRRTGGLDDPGQGESDPVMDRQGLPQLIAGFPVAAGGISGQEDEQAGQVADVVFEDFTDGRIGAELVGHGQLVDDGLEAVGDIVQQLPLVDAGRHQGGQARFQRR